jgi:hypothetical protein
MLDRDNRESVQCAQVHPRRILASLARIERLPDVASFATVATLSECVTGRRVSVGEQRELSESSLCEPSRE